MKRRGIRLCVVTAGLWLAMVVPSAAVTVDEIVARNAEARGGLHTWRAVQALKMAGEMDAGRGVRLPFQLELKRARKMRLELQFQGDTAVQVYDGTQGWKVRPFLGRTSIESMTPEELQTAEGQTELDGALIDYASKGYKLELVGQEQVDGREAFHLRVTLPKNVVRHLWVDSSSFLEVKIDGSRKLDGKPHPMHTYMRDYRLEDGLLIPHLLETVTEGVQGSQKLIIKAVVVNPKLDDSRFGRP